MWAYNGRSPGPVLRYRVGDVARIRVRNQLTQPTTVHWHGMRVPNAMDGVPGISQAPIKALPAPKFAEPDLAQATHHSLILEGGAMGGLREGELRGQLLGIRQLAQQGKVWALNGIVAADMQIEPWLRAQRGSTHVIQIVNRTSDAPARSSRADPQPERATFERAKLARHRVDCAA